MKPVFVVISFLLASASLKSQIGEWSPLPFGQTSTFWNTQTDEIILIKLDSIFVDGSYEQYGVWQKKIADLHPLCDTAYQLNGDYYRLGGFPFYSVIKDSLFRIRFSNNSEFDVLLPISTNFHLSNFIHENIYLTLDSIVLDSLLNTVDSIAYFSIYDSLRPNFYSRLAWSKNYGLIEFPAFSDIVSNGSNDTLHDRYKLFNLINEAQSFGPPLPTSDYFFQTPSEANKYFYKRTYSGIFWDSENYYPGCDEYLQIKNKKSQYYTMDYKPKNTSCFTGGYYSNRDLRAIDLSKFPVGYSFLEEGSVSKLQLYYDGNKFEYTYSHSQGDCEYEIIDAVGYQATVIKTFGILESSFMGGHAGWGSTRLRAARTNGGNMGFYPHLLGLDEITNSTLKTTPNPTSNTIKVSPENQFDLIQIYDSWGSLVIETELMEIDLSHLPSGIYFLNASSLDENVIQKIIKTD